MRKRKRKRTLHSHSVNSALLTQVGCSTEGSVVDSKIVFFQYHHLRDEGETKQPMANASGDRKRASPEPQCCRTEFACTIMDALNPISELQSGKWATWWESCWCRSVLAMASASKAWYLIADTDE